MNCSFMSGVGGAVSGSGMDVNVNPILWCILNAPFSEAVNCYDYIAS